LKGFRLRTPPLILIVDDNPTNLELLRVRFTAQGYQLVTAVDGEDALAKVREFEPDLISVVRQLKQDNKLRFIPVILVTAKADTRDVVAGLEAGGDELRPAWLG
jgi:CheY-like chemotaxis protein